MNHSDSCQTRSWLDSYSLPLSFWLHGVFACEWDELCAHLLQQFSELVTLDAPIGSSFIHLATDAKTRTGNPGIINFFHFLCAFNHTPHGFALWITSVWSLLFLRVKLRVTVLTSMDCAKQAVKRFLQNLFKRDTLCDFQWVKVSGTHTLTTFLHQAIRWF